MIPHTGILRNCSLRCLQFQNDSQKIIIFFFETEKFSQYTNKTNNTQSLYTQSHLSKYLK